MGFLAFLALAIGTILVITFLNNIDREEGLGGKFWSFVFVVVIVYVTIYVTEKIIKYDYNYYNNNTYNYYNIDKYY